jgi:hypothetical protein
MMRASKWLLTATAALVLTGGLSFDVHAQVPNCGPRSAQDKGEDTEQVPW